MDEQLSDQSPSLMSGVHKDENLQPRLTIPQKHPFHNVSRGPSWISAFSRMERSDRSIRWEEKSTEYRRRAGGGQEKEAGLNPGVLVIVAGLACFHRHGSNCSDGAHESPARASADIHSSPLRSAATLSTIACSSCLLQPSAGFPSRTEAAEEKQKQT